MYCQSCGKELPEDYNFCDRCGAPLVPPIPVGDTSGAVSAASGVPVLAPAPETAAPPSLVGTGAAGSAAASGAASPNPAVSGGAAAYPQSTALPHVSQSPAFVESPGDSATSEAAPALDGPGISATAVCPPPPSPDNGLTWTASDGTAPAPPRRRISKWAAMGVAGGVLLLALLAAAVWFVLRATADPKAAAFGAIARTGAQLADEAARRRKLWDLGPVYEGLRERAVKQELELRVRSIKDYDGEKLDIPSGAGLKLELLQDFPGRRMTLDSHFGVGAGDLFRLVLQFQDDELAMQFPQTGENWYGFDTRTWVEDYNRSVFGRNGSPIPETGREGFSVFEPPAGESGGPLPFLDHQEAAALAAELQREITGERRGRETTEVNGVPLDCERYELTVPRGALRGYIRESYRLLQDSEGYQALWERAVASYPQRSGNWGLSKEEAEKELRERLDDFVEGLQDFFAGDLTIDVYVRGGRAVKLECGGEGELGGVREEYRLLLEFGGETGPLSDALRLRFETRDTAVLELTAEGHGLVKEGAGAYDVRFTFPDRYGEAQTLAVFYEYDPRREEDNFRLETRLTDSYRTELFRMTMEGAVHTDPKQRTFRAEFDRLRLRLEDGFDLDMTGGYSIEPYDAAAKPIEAVETIPLFDLSETELLTLLGQIGEVFQGAAFGQA